MVNMHSLH
uniref:Uncharacterized protein n=1 Tax=Arundo donax TaxID=35708 RepID=A0A0A9HJ66_ARUDO